MKLGHMGIIATHLRSSLPPDNPRQKDFPWSMLEKVFPTPQVCTSLGSEHSVDAMVRIEVARLGTPAFFRHLL